MRNLAIIPARSGSKGLKDKNVRKLNGKPLLAYSVTAALESGVFDEVMVSTDSQLYAEIAREYGAVVPFMRSERNASDTASSWDMAEEILMNYREKGVVFDTFTLLQPTSPLRRAQDIIEAYKMMEKAEVKAVVSVCEAEYAPELINSLPDDASMENFLDKRNNVRRQELKKFYRLNGAIYITTCDFFQENHFIYRKGCYAYQMPAERSVDIDTQLDFLLAETILKQSEICTCTR